MNTEWRFFKDNEPEALKPLHILIEIRSMYDGGPMPGAYVEWAVKLSNGKYVYWVNNQPEYLVEVEFNEPTDDGLKFIAWQYFLEDAMGRAAWQKIKDAELCMGG